MLSIGNLFATSLSTKPLLIFVFKQNSAVVDILSFLNGIDEANQEVLAGGKVFKY